MYILCVGNRITLLEEFPKSNHVSCMACLFDTKDRRWYNLYRNGRRLHLWQTCSILNVPETALTAALLFP